MMNAASPATVVSNKVRMDDLPSRATRAAFSEQLARSAPVLAAILRLRPAPANRLTAE